MAAKVIQQLVTELTADGAKMRAEMAKSIKDTEKWGTRVSGIAKTAGIGIAAAGVAGATALGVLTKAAINNADELSKQSQSVGVAIEDLSALSYAAQMSGLSNEQLGAGLKRLSRSVFEAFEGVGPGADALELLGVKATDAQGKIRPTTDVLDDLANVFAGMEDGPAKSALAMEVFGKAGAELLPMLNGGAEGLREFKEEARRLGLVIDKDTGKAAEQFNDNLSRLGFAVDGLGLRIASSALPALNDLTAAVTDPENQEGLANIAAGIIGIGTAITTVVAGAGNFGKWLGEEIAAAVNGIDINDTVRLEQLLDDLKAEREKGFFTRASNYRDDAVLEAAIVQTEQQLKAAYARQEEAARTAGQKTGQSFSSGIAEGAKSGFDPAEIENRWKQWQQEQEAKKASEKATADLLAQENQLNNAIMSQADAYRRSLTLATESTEVQKLNYEIAYGSLKGINAEREKELRLEAERVDAMNVANQRLEERKEIEDLLMTDVERINKLWDERIAKIKELGLSEGDAAKLIAKAEAERGEELESATKKSTDEMTEYSKQAARNMQSAFADFLFDPFEDGLDGMLKNFGRIIQRMAAEAAAAQIFNALGNWGTANSGSGGWVGAAASVASLFGGAFAEGGRPPMGKISVVGDGGEPEFFVPDTAGTIVPFSKLGGNGTSLSIGSMVFPGITNANEAKRAAGAAGRELLGVMSAAQRYA
jgi:hypothetical protein